MLELISALVGISIFLSGCLCFWKLAIYLPPPEQVFGPFFIKKKPMTKDEFIHTLEDEDEVSDPFVELMQGASGLDFSSPVARQNRELEHYLKEITRDEDEPEDDWMDWTENESTDPNDAEDVWRS